MFIFLRLLGFSQFVLKRNRNERQRREIKSSRRRARCRGILHRAVDRKISDARGQRRAAKVRASTIRYRAVLTV